MKNEQLFIKFLERKKIEYLENEPLKNHTNFKIGGNAKVLCFPSNKHQLILILKFVKKNYIDYYILGAGTNVLCSDSGFDGVIVKLSKNFKY